MSIRDGLKWSYGAARDSGRLDIVLHIASSDGQRKSPHALRRFSENGPAYTSGWTPADHSAYACRLCRPSVRIPDLTFFSLESEDC